MFCDAVERTFLYVAQQGWVGAVLEGSGGAGGAVYTTEGGRFGGTERGEGRGERRRERGKGKRDRAPALGGVFGWNTKCVGGSAEVFGDHHTARNTGRASAKAEQSKKNAETASLEDAHKEKQKEEQRSH